MKKVNLLKYFPLILLFMFSCKGKQDAGNNKKSMVPVVRFISLAKSQEKKHLESLGTLVYFEKADVGSKVEGRIDYLYVKEGQRVYRGSALARVEQLSYRIAIQNARTELIQSRNRLKISRISYQDAVKNVLKHIAAIAKAKAELLEKRTILKSAYTKLSNTEALYKAGGATKTAYDGALTGLTSAKVAVTVGEKNLQVLQIGYKDSDLIALGHKGPFSKARRNKLLIRINTSKERVNIEAAKNDVIKISNNLRQTRIMFRETIVRSPIKGVIAMKNIARGEQVKKDAKLFTVMNISRVYANLSVSEDDIGRIVKKGSVQIFVDSLNKKSIWGRITLVHPLVDPRTRSVTVKVLINNYNNLLKPGMFVRANLNLIEKAKAWMVPTGSVFDKKNNKAYIYVLKNKSIFKKPVEIGKVFGDNIEIIKGLSKGDLIAIPPKNENESELSVLSDGANIVPVLPEGLKIDSKKINIKKKKNKKVG